MTRENSGEAGGVLDLGERRGHEVEEVAAPRLLHEPGGDADLALEQDVEQHDPGQQVGRGRPAGVVLLGDERAERAAQDHVEQRPDGDVEPAGRVAPQHEEVAAHDGADAEPAHRRRLLVAAGEVEEHALEVAVAVAARRPRRACRRRRPRPPVDEHDPLAQPLDLEHVVRRDEQRRALVGVELEQAGADPVGDVGVERGGGLVEHEQPGLVQRRLDDADERALARRQLHAEAVGEVARCGSGRGRRRRRRRRRRRARP